MPANLDVPLVSREALPGPYVLLTFGHPAVAREARAGQFVMIKANAAPEPLLRRPFSIMAVDAARETFTLFLKAVGPGSRALVDMRAGESAGCLGPLGQPFEPPPQGTEALLVAGGYGIAPFYMFGEELNALGRPFHGLLRRPQRGRPAAGRDPDRARRPAGARDRRRQPGACTAA